MGRTQYNLKIQQEQKDRWMKEVDESAEYDSLSHLIRLSVESEINGSDRTEPRSDSTPEDSSEVLGSLNRIENNLSDLNDRMGAVERETDASASYDMQRVLFALLPEGRAGDASADGIGASDLASRIGADVSEVRETLEDLAENSTAVWADEDSDGRTRYVGVGQ